MSGPLIIDAHAHFGFLGVFFAPPTGLDDLLAMMDKLCIRFAVCIDHLYLSEGPGAGISCLQKAFERSNGRIHYLGMFDPRCPDECIGILKRAVGRPGFCGIKIHPSFHRTPAEASEYDAVWRFATDNDVAIMAHSWSPSDYNPVQILSTPARYEKFIRAYPDVRFVLGHAGGRGSGQDEAIRLARDYPHVHMDFAADVSCYRLIEHLSELVPPEKILFGSDYPWVDPRANLSRVFLADVDNAVKRGLLADNAARVYGIEVDSC